MDTLSILICGLGLLFLLSGSAHGKCQTDEKCENFFKQTTGSCMPRSVANENPNECPREGSQLCQFPQACTCCKTCKTLECNEEKGYVCMTKAIAASSTWFDYTKDCKQSEKLCSEWSSNHHREPCLCCPKKPPMEDPCLSRGCTQAFGGHGICVNTSVTDWNLSTDIDLTFGMQHGLCFSKIKGPCCGCFKKKEDIPCKQDKRCRSRKTIFRKCYKDNNVPTDYFWIGKFCNKRKECKCYQRCKPDISCKSKNNGRCFGVDQKVPAGWKRIGFCNDKKKCICYAPFWIKPNKE